MADITQICNLALGKLGAERIMSIEDSSQPARFCKLFYEQTRDEMLQAHAWNFANKRAILSRLSDAPVFGWGCQYQLPVDCLRVLQLNGFEPSQAPGNFVIEGNRLLTDQDSAQILYIAQVTDSTVFSAMFVEALAAKLAFKLAKPLTGSATLAQEHLQEFERILKGAAAAKDGNEGRNKRKPAWVTSDLVNARFGSNIG